MSMVGMLSKGLRYVTEEDYRFIVHSALGFHKEMPDDEYLCRMFKAKMGYELNLDEPRTYNEKLQWLKLYNRNPFYSTLADKADVKKFVSERIGNQYVIPTYGIYKEFDDISFDRLPEQFVIKCTHDSGGVIIIDKKSDFDKKKARRVINHSLKRNFYYLNREWPYKNINPRIIVEKYLEDYETRELRDYKFFAFDGQIRAMFVATDRQKKGKETKFDFFDSEFNRLDLRNGHPNSDYKISKPLNFDKMKELASILSKDIPHVRVDFYEVNGKIYFGEMTFFHWSGLVPFEPEIWDERFGSWIVLPKNHCCLNDKKRKTCRENELW